ncbi:MAG: thiamine pyrophosphate-dependent enzyme [bacterium]
MDINSYNTYKKPTWCPGCGNFGIWIALKTALSQLEIETHKVTIVFDVGCSGNGSSFIKCYGFHGLHGRSLPVAMGIKLVCDNTKVIIMSGDGGALGIGVGHFIHACRRNVDMTMIIHDNQVYGLTTGQTSPASEKGYKSKTTPLGVLEESVNPVLLALSSKCGFVSQGFSGQMNHLVDLMKSGINYKGFAFINVFQPCVTYNHVNTFEYFQKRVYKLEETDYKTDDYNAALIKAQECGDKIPLGILYSVERETYEEGSVYTDLSKNLSPDNINRNIFELLSEFE